jgi:hypothetical protein
MAKGVFFILAKFHYFSTLKKWLAYSKEFQWKNGPKCTRLFTPKKKKKTTILLDLCRKKDVFNKKKLLSLSYN